MIGKIIFQKQQYKTFAFFRRPTSLVIKVIALHWKAVERRTAKRNKLFENLPYQLAKEKRYLFQKM